MAAVAAAAAAMQGGKIFAKNGDGGERDLNQVASGVEDDGWNGRSKRVYLETGVCLDDAE